MIYQMDVKDWNEKLNPAEKNLVGISYLDLIKLNFEVSDYWKTWLIDWI